MAKTVLLGKAPLTTIRHANGSRSNLPAGAVVPSSIDEADAKRLLKEGYLIEVELVDEDTEPEPVGPTTIPEILAVVGDDAEKAQAFLDAELAKGDKARKGLVDSLRGIVGGSN